MKSNIDLTSNRMFSHFIPIDIISNHIYKTFHGFPWTERDREPSSNMLIITGNKEERQYYKEIQRAICRNYCDCCGKKIIRYPWNDNTISLCFKCSKPLEKRIIPWNK